MEPSSQVGPFWGRELQAWSMTELSQALGAVPSHLSQQGGLQLPASTYQSIAKHTSYMRAWSLLPFDEKRWKAKATDLHNGLIYHTLPFLSSTLYTTQLCHSLLFLSPSLPLLVPRKHYPSKVLKSKPGNLSGWQTQEACLGQAHWSQLA